MQEHRTFAQFGVHTIFVEISTLCNMRCSFCPIEHIERPRGRMDIATFTRVIDEIASLSPTEAISLNVLGEPLLHPDIFRFLDYCAAKGIRVYLFTNGTLDQDDLRKICDRDNIEALVLSYQTPSPDSYRLRRCKLPFDQYRSRIVGAVDYAFSSGAYKKMRTEIHLANTKHLPFRDWDALTTNESGVDAIRGLADDIARLYEDRCGEAGNGEQRSYADPIESIPSDILDLREWNYWGYKAAPNVYIRIKYMGTFGALPAALPPGVSIRERTTPVNCDMLKEAICVLSDGSITNCCLDVNAEMTLGHVANGTILEALTSQRRRDSIEHSELNSVCRRCAGEILVANSSEGTRQ
jgi:organic radical activating enzyme